MGIFGWSYPPGAASDPFAPYNMEDQPCEVCGNHLDDCVCPECPVCHAYGDPGCYPGHGLVRSPEQVEGRARLDAAIKAQADADKAEAEYWERQGKLNLEEA